MASIYERQNDSGFYSFYRISYFFVVTLGVIGLIVLMLSIDLDLSFGFFYFITENFMEIMFTLLALTAATLIVGLIQVLFTSKLGEEIILLVIWVTPFLVIATSIYLYLDSDDINLLGGTAAGIIFLITVIYFKRSIRLSARLIEVGAEITVSNLSMLAPQLKAFIISTLITIIMIPGIVIVFAFGLKIHAILAILLVIIYEFMYLFVVATIRAFADASNIAYVNIWYDNSKPSSAKAKDRISKIKMPIVKYAFLMAFISRFKTKRKNGFTPLSLFKFMDFRNWPKLLLQGRSVRSTVADIAIYFGNFTLVILVVKNMRSITQAYKESAKTTFKSFAANIAGSMGFNILEGLRSWGSAILLLLMGGLYGYSVYSDILIAVIMAILFLLIGMPPLNSMFKPVVNSYRLLIYRAYTGKISSKLDSKTKEIIKEAIKK